MFELNSLKLKMLNLNEKIVRLIMIIIIYEMSWII